MTSFGWSNASQVLGLNPLTTVSSWVAALAAVWLCACSGDAADADPDANAVSDASVDASTDASVPDASSLEPTFLRETGLYSDFDSRTLADGVSEYAPEWPLWSDGAVKRRFVYLPPGSQIDTTDMDFWSYPIGTKMWKEFRLGETLLETRLIWKQGPSVLDWYYVSYAWNAEGTEATAVPNGVNDHLGTEHDIPEDRDCRKCHQRQPDFVLGFSAVQLAHQDQGVNLKSLVSDNVLTVNPGGTAPYFVVPGDGAEKEMLGYFHGNCGGCHHEKSDTLDTTEFTARLMVDSMATVEETHSYSTMVGKTPLLGPDEATALIEPGAPATSAIYLRMEERGTTTQMPEVGTEKPDTAALETLATWINSMTPPPPEPTP